MKLLSIIGARPQFIKEAVIQKELSQHPDIEEIVVHTGQHHDENMSGIFFEILKMKMPDYNLGISSSMHGEMTALMLIELEKILLSESPDVVILYGDTNSTLAGALAAAKLKIKVAHIEAGLRQNPKTMPEEINRRITDRLSDYLFTPSKTACENLKKEGIVDNVFFVGDVMYDLYKQMESKFDYSLIEDYSLVTDNYIVMTLHRDFNVDDRDILRKILISANKVSKNKKIIFPMHPRTKKRIIDFKLQDCIPDICVIPPIGYLELMGLVKGASMVITDSGGLQKESYYANKSAYILMPDTCWNELIQHGVNTLVNADNLFSTIASDENLGFQDDIYGNGVAANKIIEILKAEFN